MVVNEIPYSKIILRDGNSGWTKISTYIKLTLPVIGIYITKCKIIILALEMDIRRTKPSQIPSPVNIKIALAIVLLWIDLILRITIINNQ